MSRRYIVEFDLKNLPMIQTDFLVIGSGSAGMRAAIEICQHGDVLLVTKGPLRESNSRYAQGGIAVAMGQDDTVDYHVEDTLKAGNGLCDKVAVEIMVEEGIDRVSELIEWGAEFDGDGNNNLGFTIEAAHQRHRVVHRGDETGRETTKVLANHLQRKRGIQYIEYCFVIDLVIEDEVCFGTIAIVNNKLHWICAGATVIASGGLGQIFACTSNPPIATGDGCAIAWRAGCEMIDMEFVQFHPTTLFMEGTPHFLISETVRGEGGILLNSCGDIFMEKYHHMKELAPRDVVSRAISNEMQLTDSPCVYLDATHLTEEYIRKRFPTIYQTCMYYGLNISSSSIPVCSAAHFMMGGIRTNIETETNIQGLFACGEAACTGVHGANRLASNSLLECLVFGARAGTSAAAYLNQFDGRPMPKNSVKNKTDSKLDIDFDVKSAQQLVRKSMWKYAGIVRHADDLQHVRKILDGIEIDQAYSPNDIEAFELQNMIDVAKLITQASIQRTESRGAHYRRDFPQANDATWKKHISLQHKDS